MIRVQNPKQNLHESLHDPRFYMYHSEHTHPHRHVTYTGLSSYQDPLEGSFSFSS